MRWIHGHVLAPRSDRSAGEETKGRDHPRERPAGPLETTPRPKRDRRASTALSARRASASQSYAEAREEVVAGRRRFRLRLVARRAVVVDSAAADEHRRRRPDRRDGGHQASRGNDSAVANLRLALRRPPLIGNPRPGKIDDRVGAVDRRRPRTALAVRFPADAVDAGNARARVVTRFPRRQPAGQHADVVPFLGIHLRERTAEEPRAAGDDDLHRPPDASSFQLPSESQVPSPESRVPSPESAVVLDDRAGSGVCTIMAFAPPFHYSAGGHAPFGPRRALAVSRRASRFRRRFGARRGRRRTPAAVLPVPPNVKAEGLPPIPASIPEDLAPYGAFRRAVLLGWHPTRREILISTIFGNVPQIHSVAGPGMDRRQVTFFRDGLPATGGASYGPGGSYFVFGKDSGGGAETMQLFRFDTATLQSTLLTDGKSRNGTPAWSRTVRADRLRFHAARRARRQGPRPLRDGSR